MRGTQSRYEDCAKLYNYSGLRGPMAQSNPPSVAYMDPLKLFAIDSETDSETTVHRLQNGGIAKKSGKVSMQSSRSVNQLLDTLNLVNMSCTYPAPLMNATKTADKLMFILQEHLSPREGFDPQKAPCTKCIQIFRPTILKKVNTMYEIVL